MCVLFNCSTEVLISTFPASYTDIDSLIGLFNGQSASVQLSGLKCHALIKSVGFIFDAYLYYVCVGNILRDYDSSSDFILREWVDVL